MDSERESQFTRNPIIENQVFFLQSKCDRCGFAIVASSLEELLDEEERHRNECSVPHTTAA